MNKKYIVRLSDEERAICETTIQNEKGRSEKLRRATTLLKADAKGPAWNDAKISEAVGCRTPPAGFGHWTLRLLADQLVRLQCQEFGFVVTRFSGLLRTQKPRLDGALVELEVVESISPETVRQTLKKMA